jgi:hypothetical protein
MRCTSLVRPVGVAAGLLLTCLLFAAPVNAAPILLSFDATFTQPGFPDEVDNNLLVIAGPEITEANATNVGSVFFESEFVDVSSSSSTTAIAYQIQGGGDPHPLDPTDYTLTGWPIGTILTFSDFQLDVPGTLTGVSVSVNQAAGVDRVIGTLGGPLTPGTDYLFNAPTGTLSIFLSGLGILEQPEQLPLGTVTFNLAFQATQDPGVPAVPEPASLILFGTGLSALAAARRRARAKA